MKQMNVLQSLLPEVYAGQLRQQDWEGLEELRLGTGRPLRLRYARQERELWPMSEAYVVEEVIQRACRHSAYAYTDTIRQGYLTVEGGHRIGICGFGVTDGALVRTLRTPSSLNIRVAHQIPGCAGALMPVLQGSALLLGPPGSGKTTLLRDTIRQLSDLRRQRIGVVDERGELSACVNGTAQLDLGSRSDVLMNIPKAEAVMMLLRTMNPQWIALDEITAPEDVMVMEQASYCGVKLLATAHGETIEDLSCRSLYKKLMEIGVFKQVVLLRQDKSYSVQEVKL